MALFVTNVYSGVKDTGVLFEIMMLTHVSDLGLASIILFCMYVIIV